MKKARFILTALVLLAGIGGALAFKASRFTANPAFITTDYTTFKPGTLTYTALAGISPAPARICIEDFVVHWTVTSPLTADAFSTLPLTTSLILTATTAPGGPVLSLTRIIQTCVPTIGPVTFVN